MQTRQEIHRKCNCRPYLPSRMKQLTWMPQKSRQYAFRPSSLPANQLKTSPSLLPWLSLPCPSLPLPFASDEIVLWAERGGGWARVSEIRGGVLGAGIRRLMLRSFCSLTAPGRLWAHGEKGGGGRGVGVGVGTTLQMGEKTRRRRWHPEILKGPR